MGTVQREGYPVFKQYGDWIQMPNGVEFPDEDVLLQMLNIALRIGLASGAKSYGNLEVVMHDWDKAGVPGFGLTGRSLGFKVLLCLDKEPE